MPWWPFFLQSRKQYWLEESQLEEVSDEGPEVSRKGLMLMLPTFKLALCYQGFILKLDNDEKNNGTNLGNKKECGYTELVQFHLWNH